MNLELVGTALLPRAWVLDEGPPLTYRSADGSAPHRLQRADGGWGIVDAAGHEVARAVTRALHPVTTYPCEWTVRCEGGAWRYSEMRFVHAALETSRDDPVDLDLLGRDFFVVHALSKPIWFVSPVDGSVVHSAVKRMSDGTSGVKYCSLCNRCFSANNWYQHLMTHRHLPRGNTVTEIMKHALRDPAVRYDLSS